MAITTECNAFDLVQSRRWHRLVASDGLDPAAFIHNLRAIGNAARKAKATQNINNGIATQVAVLNVSGTQR